MKARRVGLWCLPLSVVVILAIVGGVALAGRSRATTMSPARPSAAPSPARTSKAAADPVPTDQAGQDLAARKAAVTAALSASAASAGAPDFAVAVQNHQSGVSYSFGADEPFETASVVKVEILAALLLQAREEGRPLTADERNLAQTMIQQSDNAAATALWSKIGGAGGLNDAAATLGLTETVPGANGWWGWTTTTVSDQIKLLEVIADPTGPLGDSGQVILDLMGHVADDQDWGVSAASGPGESTALKNGWMTRENQGGRWTVNSVGRITGAGTDLTMAVMTRGHTSLSQGIAFVEKVAQLTRTQLAW